MPRLKEKRNFALITLLPMLLLVGCATPLPPSVGNCPRPPQIPAARQPTPPLPYSASARIDIEKWQKRLTAMPATSEH